MNPPPLGENLPIPPSQQTVHNRRRTYQNLGVFDFKVTTKDTLNLTVGGYRSDFQIPNNERQQAFGRDYNQLERDHFQNLRWSRAIGGNKLLDVSLYHHFNKLDVGGRQDRPLVAVDNRRVDYYGSRIDLATKLTRHFIKVGTEVYFANLRDDFTILPTVVGTSFEPFRSRVPVLGKEQSLYVQDQIELTDDLALSLGLRWDAFQAKRSDTHLSPRIGLSYKVPNRQLVLFGSVARVFLPPPIEFLDVRGSLPDNEPSRGFAEEFRFVPVRPELDTQYEVGLKFPVHGFRIKVAQWYKNQKNFLDHEQLEHPSGDVNIFLPINLRRGRSWGVETFVESPSYKGLSVYTNYAFGYAQAKGNRTGGLISLTERPAKGFFFLDHDQRHTLSAGFNYDLERYGAWINSDVRFGSGFPDASRTFAGGRLPRHTVWDIAVGKRFAERWDFRVELENITNKVYPINLASEFNGTHYSPPRLVTFRFGYRF